MLPLWIVLAILPILGGAERFNCRGRILGAYYADAKSGCKAFHVCVRVAGGGIRDFRFFCPPGTLFHQEAQTCTDWGDDDPLACPADLYDGQFDLYKIGSGYDTKKLSSQGTRDEEAEFGLQRAESGDRRLTQNNGRESSDLRAAHSSDFFSGQRDRGRDDSASTPSPAPSSRAPQSQSRQSFRRATTHRLPSTTTQYTTASPQPAQPSNPPQYDGGSKRKLVRKRPIYVSTQAPTTFVQNPSQQDFSPKQNYINQQQTIPQKNQNNYPEQQQSLSQKKQNNYPEQQQSLSQKKQNNYPEQQQSLSQKKQNNYPEQQQSLSQKKQNNYPEQQQSLSQKKQNNYPEQQQSLSQKKQHNFPEQQQSFPQKQHNYATQQQSFPQKQQNNIPQAFSQQPQQQSYQPQQQFVQKPQNLNQLQNVNRSPSQNRQTTPTLPADIPAQYKDEYVEVSRVAPKQPKNRFFPTNPTPGPFAQSSPSQNFNKKDSLVELYNYESQSTPGINTQNENQNRPFKVRNSFSVKDEPREDFARTNARNAPTTVDYNTAATRGFATSSPAYKNYNSVSYEPEKNNFVSFTVAKKNYYSPTTTPTTTVYTSPVNFNTAAYNTNNALNTIQPANYNSEEDDGQYRPPEGEDDGQYRPELYERELLSGAHSLNIAASGNRLPEDQKSNGKLQVYQKPSQTSAPRPFRPAPTPSAAPTTTHAPEPTYTTTYRAPTINTQRTFDYIQTYTTTVRPSEPVPVQINFAPTIAPVRHSTTLAPKTPEPRPQTRAPQPPTITPQRPTTRVPHFANPPKKQDDSSYDYAYYDSDPGFTEYDHIEEFGRTKSRA